MRKILDDDAMSRVGSEPVVWVSLRRSCSENSEFVVFLSLDEVVS